MFHCFLSIRLVSSNLGFEVFKKKIHRKFFLFIAKLILILFVQKSYWKVEWILNGRSTLLVLEIRELKQAKLKLDMYLMDYFFHSSFYHLNFMTFGVVTHLFMKNGFQIFTIFLTNQIRLFSWNMRWSTYRKYSTYKFLTVQ